MSLKEKIEEDFKQAFKSREENIFSTLRLVKSAFQNKEIELRGKKMEFTDEEAIKVIQSEVKKRKESIEIFKQGGREDLAKQEEAELLILQKYLPEQLTENKIKEIILDVIKGIRGTEENNFGLVMKEVMVRVKGKSEGGIVSKLVKEILKK